MRVKCIMCDKTETIDDNLPATKKLRNRPIHTYMCDECQTRIAEKTKQRIQTGQFFVYRSGSQKEWLQ